MNTCIYLQWAASGRGVYCMKCVYDYGSEMLIALTWCTGLGFVLFVNLPVAANESTCLSGRNFVGGGHVPFDIINDTYLSYILDFSTSELY